MQYSLVRLVIPFVASIVLTREAQAVRVFVNTPPSTTLEHPLSVSNSGAYFFASADLPSGIFQASLTGTFEQTGTATAGIRTFPNALRFTNPGPGPVNLAPGDISVRVISDYVLSHVAGSGNPSGASSARCTATLTGRYGVTSNTVSVFHIISATFNSSGAMTGSSNNFTPTPGAGNVTNIEASLDRMEVILDQPGYTLAAGETLDLSVSVQTVGASTVGVGSANCRTEDLRVLLDPGESLQDDAGVVLTWVGAAPVVPALGPTGGLLLVALLTVASSTRRR